MARIDPDAIGDQLRATCDVLFGDCRTVGLALKLDDLRRDIARTLAVEEPAPRRVSPGSEELARRAQVAAQPRRDLEASVFAHGGRFVGVYR